ncbi:hypothetical protein, partial [Treponema endosymbiont of Eucomonympha sp.]|uniref:hypothetical protein n=1 Tax=Treponema endosymbiont of Eucomonympha sp. TaxID=1580831 RepID=UPI001EE6C0C1
MGRKDERSRAFALLLLYVGNHIARLPRGEYPRACRATQPTGESLCAVVRISIYRACRTICWQGDIKPIVRGSTYRCLSR